MSLVLCYCLQAFPSQYPNLLGRGACKKVFRAIDCELGIEVAWNQVTMLDIETYISTQCSYE